MKAIKSRKQFEEIKEKVEALVKNANAVGGFENLTSDDLALYKNYAVAISDYEKSVLRLLPLKGRSPLIIRIEEEIFNRRMTQKEFSELLGISESRLSEIINGKPTLSINVALQLHKIGIDGNLILENVPRSDRKNKSAKVV